MFYTELKAPLEAILFVSGDPIPAGRLADLLQIDKENVEELIAELKADMESEARGLTVIQVAGGYQLCTKSQYAPLLEKLSQVMDNKLSPAALETLSIIAFKQPITKQEIENIRGVRADKVVTRLLERGMIREVGRKEAVGRPILYGTTEEFLRCFGLNKIEELPQIVTN